ncbi:PrgH/EprH family type III secretion apparatus protein [Erwinia sp. E602]|uniref:PrgH/EprH family type III secretion apparatus protein n=1 Tax=Erwinia sp. E602 TaxID=2675378 RepID=UPI001BA957F3|nr:PrgH/EprH family type III secretion apparatus protein [Erwinia sp. E602]QUG74581.1 PrgH/EprH family type III secretion apparatus protein [Erwinia sp. E602]
MNSYIHKNIVENNHDNSLQNYTLKLLFGPMVGCELLLPAEDYFLLINPGSALKVEDETLTPAQQHAAHYTLNTLYIPCDTHSPNITLRLSHPSENEGKNAFQLEIQDLNGTITEVIEENAVFSYKHIHFSIKRHEQAWSDAVLNFNSLSALPQNPLQHGSASSSQKTTKLYLSGLFLTLSILFAATAVWYKNSNVEQHVSTLSDALAGAPGPVEIVKGRDNGTIYILTQGLPEMEWATQTINKLNQTNKVLPVWLSKHRQKVIEELTLAGFPVLQINYGSPEHPGIAVYRKMSPSEVKRFRTAVLNAIPFATDFATTLKSKEQLLAEARQGLDRLNIVYRQVKTDNGYVLVIRDTLSDNVLMALRNSILNFNQKWGEKIINFSVNLDEDWLKNKSYTTSAENYIFLNPKHWYFPLKQREKNYG